MWDKRSKGIFRVKQTLVDVERKVKDKKGIRNRFGIYCWMNVDHVCTTEYKNFVFLVLMSTHIGK